MVVTLHGPPYDLLVMPRNLRIMTLHPRELQYNVVFWSDDDLEGR